ncbi:serine hydrolase domain-containing protein [Sinosporangium siamense]|uniref:Serine hydrolase n=1 Tax=Sinosporangium siamense TaxID=1367973 RepID=A0A919V8K9_9ACTN|nr:serine hydrolase domain-containing protein [Sinosporangium siamense]GII93347.1 serine hydrolase [Sinosporangium siamense]
MRKSSLAAAVGIVTVGAVLVAGAPAAASPSKMQAAIDTLVRDGGVVGAQVKLTANGREQNLRAGVAKIDGDRPVPESGNFRIGSVTKQFTATVLLQLAGEGKIALDEPVKTYLPGLLPKEDKITSRMILQHTAGIPNYTNMIETGGEGYLENQKRRFTDQEIVDIALAKPLDFEPGTKFSYSNTGYVVAGMLIKAVTGNTWQSEVTKRIAKPLGLRDTSAPQYSTGIPGPNAHGYVKTKDGFADVTRLSPSIAGAGGAMISSTADLTTYMSALLGGRLLKPAQFAEMKKTITVSPEYGLGLRVLPTTCGKTIIGHTGGIPGWLTASFTTPDGKVKLAASVNEKEETDIELFHKMVDVAFCG